MPTAAADEEPLRRRRDRSPESPPTRAWTLQDDRPDEPPSATPAPSPEVADATPWTPGTALRLTPSKIPDGRTTIAEKVVFGLSIVVAPLGLLAGIAMAVISSRRRGWVPGLVGAGIVVASVLTVALGAVTVVADGVAADQVQERAARAGSQPMCRAIRVAGLDATGADFGWPTPGDSIGTTIAGIQAYADRWSAVAALAPASVKSAVSTITSTATEIEGSIAASRTIDDAGNATRMRAVRAQSALPAWVNTYCD